MQSLWGKVLAGEANNPGTYSKRTVNFVGSLDKADAALFTNLCSFAWFLGNVVPLIYDTQDEIYIKNAIDFNSLKHLDAIGLISFDPIGEYVHQKLPQQIKIYYYGSFINIRFKKELDNDLKLGHILLTKIGQELVPVCGSKPNPEFVDYTLKQWINFGYVIFSDWPNKSINPGAV